MYEALKSEEFVVTKSWTCSGSTTLDEVSFLKPGRALYIYRTKSNGANEYVEGRPPLNECGIHGALMVAFEKGKLLSHILMCHQDFETYRQIQAAAPKDTVNVNQIKTGVTEVATEYVPRYGFRTEDEFCR